MSRLLKHLFTPRWKVSSYFPEKDMQEIQQAIASSEKKHRAELCFAVEASLDPIHVIKKVNARQRSLKVFGDLRVWDTEENNGVLIYLLLADRDIEIVADRGIYKLAGEGAWEKICQEMEASFRSGKYKEGVIAGIARITEILAGFFPYREGDKNELSDKPVIL
ncbi:MAG: TPM domain-containing protein [Leptospiraceae bacterium]|nr:TPM domain-containing protein [Leptospiraceae bacterium]MCB1303517.1 TPM domain-containing protein [Leptospiraceae bacterium]